jgi:Tfp pilus assembly protein PilO
VWVLIELLGRMQNFEINVSEVAKLDRDEIVNVDELAVVQHPRRTRGKGRKIHYTAQ